MVAVKHSSPKTFKATRKVVKETPKAVKETPKSAIGCCHWDATGNWRTFTPTCKTCAKNKRAYDNLASRGMTSAEYWRCDTCERECAMPVIGHPDGC